MPRKPQSPFRTVPANTVPLGEYLKTHGALAWVDIPQVALIEWANEWYVKTDALPRAKRP